MAEQDISAVTGEVASGDGVAPQQRNPAGTAPSTNIAGVGAAGGSTVIASSRVAEPFRLGPAFPTPTRSADSIRSAGSSPVPQPSIVSGTARLSGPASPPGSFPTGRSSTTAGLATPASFTPTDPTPGRTATRSAGRAAHHHAAAELPGAGRVLATVNILFTLLGTAVAAGALIGAGRALGAARTLSLIAAGIAAVAVMIAAGVLLSRLIATSGTQGRARRADRRPSAAAVSVAPGVLLLAASALLGTAAAVTVVGPADDAVPRLELASVTAADGQSGVSAQITVAPGTAGDPIAVSLSAVGDPATVLSSQVRRASGTAADTVKVGGTVRDARSVQVDVSLVGRRCRAVIAIREVIKAEETRLTCRRS